jgi:hypothetical protein
VPAYDIISAVSARIAGWLLPSEQEIKETIAQFPVTLERAQEDWAKFKLGVEAGLFSPTQREEVLDWYDKLPDAWAQIRPNWTEPDPVTGMASPRKIEYARKVDAWMTQFKGDREVGLGAVFVTVVIVGAVLLAITVGGIYSIAYYREQANISAMIEAETQGRLEPGTVKSAIEAEKGGGVFAGIGEAFDDFTKIGLTATVAYLFGPQILSTAKKLIGKVKL